MDNGGRSTLTTLVTIKKRRERSIRSTLAMLEQQEATLLASKASLLEARRALWVEWRECADEDAVHDYASLQALKRELAGFHQRDQTLADRIEAVDAQWQALRLERDGQLDQLRRALVDQEKLNALLE
ncbi:MULTISPECIES: hypothetical protein [Burkholderia]|uniref:Type III secretion protein n=1 Tax=Burkholderia savannae TaxID=1637837 RepID=A0ABR5T8I8_9BURK|nr:MULTISPECIES: hypothetical protein [Burkholderia]AOK49853.1 hypothetical protein WT60_23565 [Burkholderia sp. MSMB617WGS]KGS02388.1 hypothetical protein X946_3439 [Burkholderia sp. ABCPW 111]KVK89768.1 hypothetical protein WS91_28170 [Burkholderia sp. MSMB1498]AOJ71459.1 hypothetical protein WS78_21770 [Burkholderia savannae]AOJ83915.1 hypothetical protein WS86_25240 [Burkholderia savannae]